MRYKGQKWLVTGAAGFIGCHFTETLLKEGATVTGYDNLSSGKKEWLGSLLTHPRFRFREADLLDYETLRETSAGHDVVVHLGANTSIPKGSLDPRLDLDNCLVATVNLLEAMRETGVRQLLFASSASVYGEQWASQPLTEDLGPLLPISRYAAAKLGCEAFISATTHLFDLQAWIFRFGNVVGGRMGHGVVYDFVRKIRHNPAVLEVLGDGKQEKNYFLVEDCVDGMLFTFDAVRDRACDVFNLGNESSTKVTKIAQIVTEEMGLTDIRVAYAGGKRGWPGDQPVVLYDTSKMKQLGWQPRYSSDEAVRIAAKRLLGREQQTLVSR
jgi:UDP-glucose 4-epimerase